MGDVERGRITLSDEDRLPWLEAVEDEDDEDGVSLAKLIALVIVALVAIGLVVGGVFWMRRGLQSRSAGGVITAPAGDYKVPATDAKGMEVDGLGDASYAASQGENVSSTIDTTRVPERPLTEGMAAAEAAGAQIASSRIDSRGAAPAAPVRTVPLPPAAPAASATRPAPAPASAAARPTPAARPAPAATASATSSTPAPSSESTASADTGPKASKQIGAYSTEAKAEAGRRDLTSRFPALRSLDLTIQEGTSNGKTVYRIFMRGGPAKVSAVCAALHSAKEGCIPG